MMSNGDKSDLCEDPHGPMTIPDFMSVGLTDTTATGDQQVPRNRGWFSPGRSGNPGGRPVGSRNKLQADFLRELSDAFDKRGREAIERMIDEDPAAFIKVVASLLPKDVTVSARPFAAFSDDELLAALQMIQRYLDACGPSTGPATIEGELARPTPDGGVELA